MVEVPESDAVVTTRRKQHRTRTAFAGAAVALVLLGGTAAAVGAAHTGSGTHAPVAVQPHPVQLSVLQFREVLGEQPCPRVVLTPDRDATVDAQQVVLADKAHKNCYVLGPTLLTGTDVGSAQAVPDPSAKGWIVNVHFKNNDFVTKVARPYLGKQVAIVFDGNVVSASTINPGITTDDVAISGNFTQAEAEQIAAALGGPAASTTVEPSTTVPIVSPPVTRPSTSPNSQPRLQVDVTVPNLVLMYPPDALNTLQSVGLHGTLVDKCVVRYQSDVQGTDPPAGSRVAPGSNVVVYVGIVCDPNSTVPTTIGSTTAGK